MVRGRYAFLALGLLLVPLGSAQPAAADGPSEHTAEACRGTHLHPLPVLVCAEEGERIESCERFTKVPEAPDPPEGPELPGDDDDDDEGEVELPVNACKAAAGGPRRTCILVTQEPVGLNYDAECLLVWLQERAGRGAGEIATLNAYVRTLIVGAIR